MNIVSLKYDDVFREAMSHEGIRKQLISDVTGIPVGEIKGVRLGEGDAVNDWIRLFNADTREGLDMIRTKNAGVMEAVEVVRRMNLGRMLREPYESYMKARMDRRAEDEYVRNEGKAEGMAQCIIQILHRFGDIPQDLQEKILAQQNLDTLEAWFGAAVNAGNLREFEDNM